MYGDARDRHHKHQRSKRRRRGLNGGGGGVMSVQNPNRTQLEIACTAHVASDSITTTGGRSETLDIDTLKNRGRLPPVGRPAVGTRMRARTPTDPVQCGLRESRACAVLPSGRQHCPPGTMYIMHFGVARRDAASVQLRCAPALHRHRRSLLPVDDDDSTI